MLHPRMRKVIRETDLTEEYLEKKVSETLTLMKAKGLIGEDKQTQRNVFVGYDMNGPLTATWDASLYPYPRVQKGLLALHGDNVSKAILSGWDLASLRNFRDHQLGIKEMGLVGELGAVYEHEGKIAHMHPIDEEKHYAMKLRVFQAAADAGLKIAVQGNVSNRVQGIYFEADGRLRGNLRNHFLVEGTDIATQDIYEAIRDKQFFEYDGKKIRFTPNAASVKELDYVLSQVHTLNSVRMKTEGKKIALWRDEEDRKNFSIDQMIKFAEKTIPGGWAFESNHDFCIDISYVADNAKLSKEATANELAKKVFGEGYIMTNIGDKKGDVLVGANSVFFPQIGTSAEEYCNKQNIPHVSVVSALDYSLVLASIFNKWYQIK